MKKYHVKTREDYDALMIELESKGYNWTAGQKPRCFDGFKKNEGKTLISAYDDLSILFGSIEEESDRVIEYKAKGKNMTQEEMKNDLLIAVSEIVEAISKIGSDENTTEHLSVVKSRSKRLLKNASNMLDVEESEFKVGDYVTYEGIENKIAKIDSIDADELHGLWYGQETEGIGQDCWLKGGHTVRHATPEEIAEYKAALNFHKHGRKPFEVKKGDLLFNNERVSRFFVADPSYWQKNKFISGDLSLLKTTEEVNEWLGADDETK